MLRCPTVEFESQPFVEFRGIFNDIPRNFLATFPGMFGDILRNVWEHFPECLETFSGMFQNIPRNFSRYFPEYLATFYGMFSDIHRNVWRHPPERLAAFPGIWHSPRSLDSVPRSCIPGFINSLTWTCQKIRHRSFQNKHWF